MALPVIRRYTLAAPANLDVFENMTDDESGQAQFLLLAGNAILDLVNDPDPAGGLTYEYRLQKNGVETQIRAFSSASSANSAGRQAIGPVSMSAGNYIWKSAQRTGALTDTSMVVKYAKPLN